MSKGTDFVNKWMDAVKRGDLDAEYVPPPMPSTATEVRLSRRPGRSRSLQADVRRDVRARGEDQQRDRGR